MAFVVLYDASVLYPNTLRDLLLRIAQSGLAQAKWTEQILDEVSPLSTGTGQISSKPSSTAPEPSWVRQCVTGR